MDSGKNNIVSMKDKDKRKTKGEKRKLLATSDSSPSQPPRQLTQEEIKFYKENGFVLVRGALSERHIRSMQREIEILKMKYKRENRSCEEESCTLDPFVNSTIPESSPERTSVKSYLALRTQSFDSMMKGGAASREIETKDGEEKEVSSSHEDEDIRKRKRARLTIAANNLISTSSSLADSCKLHPGSAPEVILRIFPALCSQLMQSNRAYLFNENYIVKPANSALSFAWHKDAEEQLGIWFKANTMQYISGNIFYACESADCARCHSFILFHHMHSLVCS
mmetsp:Transcript_14796/g.23479  ORF Transcript_14796/g.23479 Transcript_14796/m.23479 type:complete len:281 (+) Transcript_14796:239-1081(+)